MDTSAFDTQIEQLRISIEADKQKLESLSQQLIQSLKTPLTHWCKEKVSAVVKANPERIKALKAEGVAQLKAELEKFYEELPVEVQISLNDDNFWNHRAGYAPKMNATMHWHSLGEIGASGINPLHNAIEELQTGLVPIFVEHNVLAPQSVSAVNFTRDPAFYWPQGASDAASQYALALKKLKEEQEEVRRVEREKVEAEAEDLWNS